MQWPFRIQLECTHLVDICGLAPSTICPEIMAISLMPYVCTGLSTVRPRHVQHQSALSLTRQYCELARPHLSVRAVCVRNSASQTVQAPADLLLNWIADQPGAIRPKVLVDSSPSAAGRRLQAAEHADADDVLLSVPLTTVFADIEVHPLRLVLTIQHTPQHLPGPFTLLDSFDCYHLHKHI